MKMNNEIRHSIGNVLVIGALFLLLIAGIGFANSIQKTQTPKEPEVKEYSIHLYLQIVNQINEERELRQLPLLMPNDSLMRGAQARAQQLQESGQWSHDGYIEAITASGYEGNTFGENIARNFSSSREIVPAWIASKEHEKNVLSKKYKHMGVGVYKNYVVLWVGG